MKRRVKKYKARMWKGTGWISPADSARPPYIYHSRLMPDFFKVKYEIREIARTPNNGNKGK